MRPLNASMLPGSAWRAASYAASDSLGRPRRSCMPPIATCGNARLACRLGRNLVLGEGLREATLGRLLVPDPERLSIARVDVIHQIVAARGAR